MMMDEFPGGWPFSTARSPSWLNPRSNLYTGPQYDNYYYPGHRSFNRHFSPFGWDLIYDDDLPLTRRKPKHSPAQPSKDRKKLQNKKPNTASTKQPNPEDITTTESDRLKVSPPEVVVPTNPNAISELMPSEEPTDSLKDDELESSVLSNDDDSADASASQHSSEDEDHGLSRQDIENRLAVVERVKQKAVQLKEQVNSFAGQKESKEFLFLDESLLSLLLELDKVETMGCTDIRQARKTTVLMIQELHSILESRAVNVVN